MVKRRLYIYIYIEEEEEEEDLNSERKKDNNINAQMECFVDWQLASNILITLACRTRFYGNGILKACLPWWNICTKSKRVWWWRPPFFVSELAINLIRWSLTSCWLQQQGNRTRSNALFAGRPLHGHSLPCLILTLLVAKGLTLYS